MGQLIDLRPNLWLPQDEDILSQIPIIGKLFFLCNFFMVVIKTKIPYLKELIKKVDVMRVKIDHNFFFKVNGWIKNKIINTTIEISIKIL